MMKPTSALAMAAMLLTAACGGKAADPVRDVAAQPAVAPAIIAPHEIADPALPPSYEVAIAGVAAEHNAGMKRCATQPESVRAQCEQEANVAFSKARDDLDHLRGNQE